MRIRKELLKIGKHHTRGGVLDATPDWVDRKVKQAQKLLAAGNIIPVSWGHHTKAVPLDPERRKDEGEFHRSKFRAGSIDKIERVGDRVFFEAEVPAVKRVDESGHLIHDVTLEDGTTVEAAINEVSAGFGNWTDGQGNKHEDCLIHAALCTHPIYANQKGFTVAEENRPPILLSASTWFGSIEGNCSTESVTELAGQPMPTDNPTTKPDDEKPVDKETTTDETTEQDKKPDETPGTTDGETKPVPDMLKDIGQWLSLSLPDQIPTDPAKALHMLYIAACAKGKPEIDPALENAMPAETPTAGAILLSSAMNEKGYGATMAKNLDTQTRAALTKRLEALKTRGLSESDVKDIEAMIPRIELSVQLETGDLIETDLHKMLGMLERNLPSRTELSSETELTEVEPPTHAADTAATIKELEKRGVMPKKRETQD